ncbi:hypothetical protein [Gimesia sp.]|uniref:restriction endonuclease n=1 Tax=Gimesia sp. TaxID=2024833 RepID=UPI00341604FA
MPRRWGRPVSHTQETQENDKEVVQCHPATAKPTHDRDKRRDIENRKIDCGRAHFDALGVDYEIATNFRKCLHRGPNDDSANPPCHSAHSRTAPTKAWRFDTQ